MSLARSFVLILCRNADPFWQTSKAVELPSFISKYVDSKHLGNAAGASKGYEFTVMNQKMHFKPDEWQVEAAILVASLLYLFLHFTGKARNRSLVSTWVKTAMPLLEDEFAAVAKRDDGSGEGKLIWNGASQALLYASGRRGVEGFVSLPLPLLLFVLLRSLRYADTALSPIPKTVSMSCSSSSPSMIRSSCFTILSGTLLWPVLWLLRVTSSL